MKRRETALGRTGGRFGSMDPGKRKVNVSSFQGRLWKEGKWAGDASQSSHKQSFTEATFFGNIQTLVEILVIPWGPLPSAI